MKQGRGKNIALGLGAAIAIAAGTLFLQQSPPPKEPAAPPITAPATATFHGLTPAGIAGDPILNAQKNRWTPPVAVKDITINEVFSFAHEALERAGERDREKWDASALAQAKQYESMGVRIEGYILDAKKSGLESSNGKNDSLRDFHLWVATSPDAPKQERMVVEPIPFYLEKHPEWSLANIRKAIKDKAKVRLSGWILWDEEHSEEVGKSRGTLWEIHPVTKIEIMENNSWVDLHDLVQNLP